MTRGKKMLVWSLWIGCAVLILIAGVGPAAAEDASCQYCGMKKEMYGHSWVTIEREDGSKTGLCSVHCAALDMALHIDSPAVKVMVGDYNSKNPIDAETAFWVIGGSKMGVMTKRAKWAFTGQADAEAFIKAFGGQPADFEQVMKAAFEDMYEDTRMIQEKRRMMRMKKGGHKS